MSWGMNLGIVGANLKRQICNVRFNHQYLLFMEAKNERKRNIYY